MIKLEEQMRILDFPDLGDERGNLVVVEGMQDIPFSIERIFYIYGSDGEIVRGKHANINSEFVLVNVAGSCKVKVDDGRGNIEVFSLDKPRIGLYLPKLVWKEMYEFSQDSVLLCLASEHYDELEYLRDYDGYIRYLEEHEE